MPKTAAPTSLFSLETRLISAKDGLSYVVDKTSQVNMLRATHGKINEPKITPASLVANVKTTYTISFIPTHDIVVNGKISVTLPDECKIVNPSNT